MPDATLAPDTGAAPLPTPERLHAWAAEALDAAHAAGATSAETNVSVSRALSLTVRNGDTENLEFQRDRGVSITAYVGQKVGSASTADLSPAGLKRAAQAAVDIARVAGEDPAAGLADPARLADTSALRDLSLHHPWPITADAAIDLARACEAAAMGADARVALSEGAGFDTREGVGVYANSHGFSGFRTGTSHSLSASVIARDAAGNMQPAHHYTGARDWRDLVSAEATGRRAGEKAAARLGARKLSTRPAPVLYVPEMARGLFASFLGAISGGALFRKATFLLDALDTPVFSPVITARELPFIPKAASSANFDAEGVATKERTLLDAGVLTGWLLSSYSARRLNLETTGNAGGIHNLVVEPGAHDLDALLREMGEGLMVTSLMGQGTNPVTGEYSRGASGFWVENGEIAYPVQEITVAGNLKDMFKAMRLHGSDIDTRAGIRCGSLLIDGMVIAGE